MKVKKKQTKEKQKSSLVLQLLNIFLACHWNVSTDYFAWNDEFNICFDRLSFLCKIKTFSKVRLLIMLWKINLVIHIDKKKGKERNEEWKSRGELKIERPGSINFSDVAGLIDWVTSNSRLSVCLAFSNTHTHHTHNHRHPFSLSPSSSFACIVNWNNTVAFSFCSAKPWLDVFRPCVCPCCEYTAYLPHTVIIFFCFLNAFVKGKERRKIKTNRCMVEWGWVKATFFCCTKQRRWVYAELKREDTSFFLLAFLQKKTQHRKKS